MNILLVNVDGRFNIAIRRMYNYFRADHEVAMKDLKLDGYPDRKKVIVDASGFNIVYSSNIFEINQNRFEIIGCSNVVYGGIGSINPSLQLPIEIEKTDPFYFHDEDTSYGFITRGCPNECWFCKVPKFEGKLKAYNSIESVIKHDKVKFLDNNILAYDKHMEVFKYLIDRNIKCEFNQGLDFRLINEDNAKLLSNLNYMGEYIFAFDDPKYQPLLERQLKIIKKYIYKNWKLKFYIYQNKNMDIGLLINRVEWCRKNKSLPYVMRDINCWDSEERNFYIDYAAYCNQPSIFKNMDFETFLYKRTKNQERIRESLKIYNTNMKEKILNTDAGKEVYTLESTKANDNPIFKIKHDGQVAFATGSSKTSKHWKNKNILYSVLVEKLSNTTRTHETYSEYKKMPKTDRDRIKDVGGFVGGSLKNGRRKAENVANRTLLTLDLDYVVGDVWSSIELLWDFSVTMYSTHTHASDNQRLRIVIPLSRPVLPDEYQAIARMIADDIGIDQFDDTTYEPSRLMYWPSTSSDGDYVFKVQDLEWLNPDEILERYTFGWEDVSYWPESSRARAKLNSAIKKQEDPLEKKGVIGAFCRTYSISEAIAEFLEDIYTAGADDTRYTYTDGSTSGGLVIYEDKFSFSHHGTDPTSGMLCNAFDLIRIHKFGDLDDDAKEDTPANRLPSFTRMSEFAANDNKVMQTLGKERMEKAQEDFDTVIPDEEISTEWLENLTYTVQGKIGSTISNFSLVIENEPLLRNNIAFNEFSNRAVVVGKLPWRNKNNKEDWNDTDDSGLREFIEKYYGISSTAKCADALALSFEKHSFHPIKDYLNSVSWDGVERVNTVFIDYLGAEDCSYVRTVSKKVLTAAVARVFVPGIKFDNMLILSGKQGVGKSTIIKKLGKDWYSDSLSTVSGKEAYEQLQGVWILEMAEMMATKKADIEATKHFLSKTEDIYRVAYGRRTSRFPRQCIFIGTSNEHEFLRDSTGNRRFWPVDIAVNKPNKNVFKDLDNEVDQIWAEALQLFKNNEPLYLSHEEEQEAKKQQESHSEESAKAGLIEEYLNKPITDDWYGLGISEKRNYIHGGDFGETPAGDITRSKTCVMEIWCELFNGEPKMLTPIMSREINDILKGIEGWKSYDGRLRFGKTYGTQRAFVRV